MFLVMVFICGYRMPVVGNCAFCRAKKAQFPTGTGIMQAMKRALSPFLYLTILTVLLVACGSSSAQTDLNAASAYIENKGSDTIVNLALAWAERYQSQHPDVRISVTGGGSGTG